MEHKIPKKLGVLATHGDGEPPKTLDVGYVKNIIKVVHNIFHITSIEGFRRFPISMSSKYT